MVEDAGDVPQGKIEEILQNAVHARPLLSQFIKTYADFLVLYIFILFPAFHQGDLVIQLPQDNLVSIVYITKRLYDVLKDMDKLCYLNK